MFESSLDFREGIGEVGFFEWVILLGSFFEKQVIGMETGKDIMIIFIQLDTENDDKLTPGRPQSRPWRGLGSDALLGSPVSVRRISFLFSFISLFVGF